MQAVIRSGWLRHGGEHRPGHEGKGGKRGKDALHGGKLPRMEGSNKH
jgi:hypothetical protein